MLDSDIQYLTGVGPKRAGLFRKLGVRTVRDLLRYPPRRYLDRSLIKPVGELRPGEPVTVFGQVRDASVTYARRGFSIFNLLLEDDTGHLLCRWFNQPYLKQRFLPGDRVVVSGTVRWDHGLGMANPEYEVIDSDDAELIHTGRIVPLYPSTAGLSNRQIRAAVRTALDRHLAQLEDPLPPELLGRLGLAQLRPAVAGLHFPPGPAEVSSSHRRLAFDELLSLQLILALQKSAARASADAPALADVTWREHLRSLLPFQLTPAQERVLSELDADLGSSRPMYRLLQGDVGSGKTVVAFAATLKAVLSGFQASIMAPTEILAEQHFTVLKPWLDRLGIPAAMLTSRIESRAKAKVLHGLEQGSLKLCIGTHALIQGGVAFRDLALAVIDEQHRFGVRQRAALRSKGRQPHILIMTATPIPRTLAMACYGDLDISVIDQMPPGRQPIVTRWTGEHNRAKAYDFVRSQVAQGRQAYVVCPVIEESEKQDLKAAAKLHRQLAVDFPEFDVGLVHGRLKLAERQRTMESFRAGRIDVLVATTVIEVGIDVPNASVMVV